MKELLIWLIAGIAYSFNGVMFTKITNNYLAELAEKTEKINPRFVNKLWIYLDVYSDWAVKIVKGVCWVLWPVTCIASILHAERQYSIIRTSCYRMEP